MGSVTKVPSEEVSQVRELYLARHANASYWVDFNDFGFFRLAIEDIYFVGGFGSMGWVAPKTMPRQRWIPLQTRHRI